MKTLIFSLILLLFVQHVSHAEEVTFETNVSVKRSDQPGFVDLKAGEKLKVKRGESYLAVPKQGLPILIVSATDNYSLLTITNANLSAAATEILQPQLDRTSNEIVDTLRRADALIQKRSYEQAAQIIVPLRERYPRVSSILFMDGTIHYLLNDKATAITSLEKGLEISPGNEEAKNLLLKLRGGA